MYVYNYANKQCRPGRLKFYDIHWQKIGRQLPRNRLNELNDIEIDLPCSALDDVISIKLKKMATQTSQEVLSTM